MLAQGHDRQTRVGLSTQFAGVGGGEQGQRRIVGQAAHRP